MVEGERYIGHMERTDDIDKAMKYDRRESAREFMKSLGYEPSDYRLKQHQFPNTD